MKKSIFDDMRHLYRLHYNSCFYNKMRYTVKLRACAAQYATSVRQIAGINALQVRRFSGNSALPPTLKSVQNQCEIFNGFYLKFQLIKVYRGYLNFLQLDFRCFLVHFFTSILIIGGIFFEMQFFM